MSADDRRPDPDALLSRVTAEAERERRAKLRIFFGFAPGVGKTYRMLQVTRDLVRQHVDVVVGAVETHGRYDTGGLLLGLEILPRKKLEYRGKEMEEFDLDSALARKPAVLILDELAHTNVPGMRHTKRWQDALELLHAGIDVYTTLNVQHVESLNDVVAQITRVQVRETVPDSVLERADTVELVDISPEELLTRLREGKVYLPDQATRATNHFFQRGNLLALRELALRRTAERVDVDVQEYREQEGVRDTWLTSERILVCISPSPRSDRLLRAARRMAAGLRAPWVAAYVEPPGIKPPGEADNKRLEQYVRLAESLGASVVRLTGATVSGAILDYARKHSVTRLIVGKPRPSRFRTGLRRSLLDQIVAGSGDIDVHVISGDPGADETRTEPPRRTEHTPWTAYMWAAVFVTVTTGLAIFVRALYKVPDLEILYVVTVMLAALRLGRAPSLFAAALSVLAYDFYFVPPERTFEVGDWRYFLSFLMMFGVGWLVSTLTTRIRRQEEDAAAREERTRTLFELGRDLAYARTVNATAAIAAKHAARAFESSVLVLMPNAVRNLERQGAEPPELAIDAQDMGVAKWVFEHGRVAGLGTETLPGARVICVPLQTTGEPVGALVLQPRRHISFDADQRARLDAFARQAAFALERALLAREAEASAVRAKTEEMRSSLLSAVSHDLRTPLATITGAVSTLRDRSAELPRRERDELLSDIQEEAARLERLVANLLDMTRVESGSLRVQREWVPLEELVGSALARLDRVLKGRDVDVSIAPALPLLSVDPILIEQVLVNLVENATKYTPDDTRIDIDGRVEQDRIVVEVRDRGPGIRPGDEHRVFEKFYRAAEQSVGGAGLGLAICKGIVDAHGGSISVENRTGGGATFRITLPVPADAPAVETADEERRAEPGA
jgi:two-component system, OmpR family, sensor histidine kinase KdpD